MGAGCHDKGFLVDKGRRAKIRVPMDAWLERPAGVEGWRIRSAGEAVTGQPFQRIGGMQFSAKKRPQGRLSKHSIPIG